MQAPAPKNSVPRLLEPRKLAAQSKTIVGNIASVECLRLLDAVESIKAPIQVDLAFYKDEQNRVRLSGSAEVRATRECQRCLEPLDVDLRVDLDLAVVFSEEEMRNLPKDIDTWFLQEESGDIVALVEDELLVALPIVSSHPEGTCVFPSGFGPLSDDSDDGGTVKKDNPFAVLQSLKK